MAFTYYAQSTTATRYSCSLTTNATANDSLTLRVWPGGTAGSGTVVAWGAQLEALPYMSSYTGEVLGTPLTRSGDSVTWTTTTGLNPRSGCVAETVTPSWTGVLPGAGVEHLIYPDDNDRLLYGVATTSAINAYDGARAATINANFVAGSPRKYISSWDAALGTISVQDVTDGTSATSSTGFTGYTNLNSPMFYGGARTWLSDIILGRTPGACQ